MGTPSPVIAYVCNWEGYRGLEMAAQQGLQIPAGVKIVRVSCLSRLHTGLLLRAFEKGAAGVILIGCAEHQCHYGTDKNVVDANVAKARSLLALLGLPEQRLQSCRISQEDGTALVNKLIEFYRAVQA